MVWILAILVGILLFRDRAGLLVASPSGSSAPAPVPAPAPAQTAQIVAAVNAQQTAAGPLPISPATSTTAPTQPRITGEAEALVKSYGWIPASPFWLHPETNAKGYWRPDGTFVNCKERKVFDPKTGVVSDYLLSIFDPTYRECESSL